MTFDTLVLFALIAGVQCVAGFLAFLWLMRASASNTSAIRLLTAENVLRTNRIIAAAQKLERLTRLGK